MGLDTSHDCWHGPYSAFTRWRNQVAEAAGYAVEMSTSVSGFSFPTAVIDWETIERENPGCYMGEWKTPQADPLVYLIAHSDCDGVLHPAQAAPLADRLEALLPMIPEQKCASQSPKAEGVGHDRPRERAVQFIAGLRKAVAAGEDVDFH